MTPLKRWIEKVSPEGYHYRVWEMPMPVNVPPNWLDCSFYVYKTVDDAKKGSHYGGSGCLVGVPSVHDGWVHLYAVTNRHVLDEGYGVLRLNTFDGPASTVVTQWCDWDVLDESGDVAVKLVDLTPQFRWKAIMIDEFMSREAMEEFSIWPGAEAFMIGRLVNKAGVQKNTPVVRFGNLSMLPDPTEPVDMAPYGEHEAFLVECRSLSGFSGSPVFLTSTQTFQPRDGKMPQERKYSRGPVIELEKKIEYDSTTVGTGLKVHALFIQGTFGPWFIGIDRGHIPLWKPVYEDDGKTKTGDLVEQNTGIAAVIPAWKIVDVLNKESLVKQRKKEDEDIGKRRKTASVADVATEPTPFTRSDFETALTKASRKISSSRPDSEKK